MSQVMQARCPHCKNVLRIPAEWLAKPMRCKYCRQIFQTKPPSATPAPAARPPDAIPVGNPPRPPSAVPVARPAAIAVGQLPRPVATPVAPGARPNAIPLAQTPRDPFAFDGSVDGPPLVRPRLRRGGRWWTPLVVLAVLAAAGGAVAYFAGPQIQEFLAHKDKDKSEDNKIASVPSSSPSPTVPPTKVDPPKKQEDPPKKVEDPPKKQEDPPKKVEDPPKKVEDPPKKVEDPPKKKEDPPKKVENPPKKVEVPPKKKEDPPKKVEDPPKPPEPDIFPRRALVVSVNTYSSVKPDLHYGRKADDPRIIRVNPHPGSSTRELIHLFKTRLHIPANQIAELSNGKYPAEMGTAVDPVKANIENAINDFVSSSREQDRLILYFAGHAVDSEEEAFLVPLEGELDQEKSLINIKWVLDKLATCKGQEKVLILDVCRLTSKGDAGPGPVGDKLDAVLQKPPAGVQVWTACAKGQHSIETDNGAVFLQALCAVLPEAPLETKATAPFGFDALVPKVNEKMKSFLLLQKAEQVSQLIGDKGKDGPFDAKAAAAPDVVVKDIVGRADPKMVKDIVDEIMTLPNTRANFVLDGFMPPLPPKVLALYKKDFDSITDFKADPEKQPVRWAVVEAVKRLKDAKLAYIDLKGNRVPPDRAQLDGSGASVDKKTKDNIFRIQKEPGQIIFEFEAFLPKLLAAGEKIEEEPSKFWQAHYHYVLARFQAKLVYSYEYTFVLAQVRGDQLPDSNSGWKLASRKKVQISESKVKDMVKNISKLWKSIGEQYPGTPWAILASRERTFELGLEWKPRAK